MFLAGECVIIFSSDKKWISYGGMCKQLLQILFSGFLTGECVTFLKILFSGFLMGECVKNFANFIFGVSRGGMCKIF